MDKKSHKPEHAKVSHHKVVDQESDKNKPVDSKKSLIAVFVIVGVIIIILVATALLSKYLFNKNPNIVEYNHYVFEKFEGNKWMTQQMIRGQLYNIPFYNNPTEVLDIPIDPASVNRLRDFSYSKYNASGTVYISIDPDQSSKVVIAGVEYARILGKAYNIYNLNVKSAINKPVNQTTEYPVITCKNQSVSTIVIYQTMSDKNLVSINGNCITIEAINDTESIRVADAFSFKLLNIIPLDT